MHRLFSAPFAKFLEFDFTLHGFLVLSRPIVNALTGFAGEFYKFILRHMGLVTERNYKGIS